MNGPAHILRTAWRALLQHAGNVARSSGREAIGWLLGFYVGGEPYVLDAHPATRYKHQSRYGAIADPMEEAEIVMRYPRNVGIVGLYHSHPFKDDTRHAIFHSATDDATLTSRASRRENFVSVVTDGRSAECFVLRDGFPAPVTPAIVETLSMAGHLKRYTTSVAPSFSLKVSEANAAGVVAALEKKVSADLDRAVRSASVGRGTVELDGLGAGAIRNRLVIQRDDDAHRVELSLRLDPTVFVAGSDEDEVLLATRNEILDDVLFLLWRGFDASAVDLAGVERFEANLGSLSVHETTPLPKKVYRAPKRATVLRRRA